MNTSRATSSDRRRRALFSVALVASLVAACAPVLSNDRPDIHVDNGTELPIAILINGVVVGDAGRQTSGEIPGADLPGLPWHVEARTGGGRSLTSFDVDVGTVTSTRGPNGGTESSGAFGRVDLSCGRLDIWVGAEPPLGPMPGPGVPGDCEP